MKNILICSNRGIASKFIFDTICSIGDSYYNRYKNDKVYFLSSYSDKKRVYNLFKKERKKVFFDDVILLNEIIDFDYLEYENWLEVYNKIDLSKLPKFDEIIEIGSGLSANTNIRAGLFSYDKLFMNKSQFTFLSIKLIREYILSVYKIATEQNIPLNHYIIDPHELNYNDIDNHFQYKRWFQYNSKVHNFSRDDAFLDYFKKVGFDSEKQFDFVFGYTAVTNERKNDIYDFLVNELKDFRYKIFLRDKFLDVDTFIPKNQYLEYIRSSKFTLIIPAYDTSTFSAFRYIESIYNGCLPLILEDNDLSEVRDSLYIPDEIIVNRTNIQEKIKSLNYEEILNKIKEKI